VYELLKRHQLLWTICVSYLALGGIYLVATPLFEASDELWHMGMVNHLADHHALPVQDPNLPTDYEQEGSQPPLYYWLSAQLVRALDRSDFHAVTQPNPHVMAGIPLATHNKNLVLHPERPPALKGSILAGYILRGVSLLLGLVTLVGTFQSAKLVLQSEKWAAIATAWVAFNPMFLFISASVNNDNLVIALNSLVIWLLLRMIERGYEPVTFWVLPILVALASLSKLSGNIPVPVIALVALVLSWRTKRWGAFFRLGFTLLGVWLVVSGWWYVRNLALYGELFGTRMMAQVAGERLEPFTLMTLWQEFEGFRIAYWGLFGAVNILTWNGFYRLMDGFVLVACVGLVITIIRDKTLPLKIMSLMAIFALASASLIGWTSITYASQGRLLFPIVAATSPLLVLGLRSWGGKLGRIFALSSSALLMGTAILSPFMAIIPAYRPSPTITQLPADATPIFADFGFVELVGYTVEARRYFPNDNLDITLYWQITHKTALDYSLFITAVDSNGEAMGKVDTFPSGGLMTTSTWHEATLFMDRYRFQLHEVSGQFPLSVQVGWWDRNDQYATAYDGNGRRLDAVILQVGGYGNLNLERGASMQELAPAPEFANQIELVAYHMESNQLTLAWRTLAPILQDYTVFAHLIDPANQTIVAQADAPPNLPTRFWQRDEIITTAHNLALPTQDAHRPLQLWVGWYSPVDFSRLSLPTNPNTNAYLLLDW